MYRVLDQNNEVRERRQQVRHPVYKKPELLAQKLNEGWFWGITKRMGPRKWSCIYLYVILDIFSRCIVGWRGVDSESAALFKPLFEDALEKHNVQGHDSARSAHAACRSWRTDEGQGYRRMDQPSDAEKRI